MTKRNGRPCVKSLVADRIPMLNDGLHSFAHTAHATVCPAELLDTLLDSYLGSSIFVGIAADTSLLCINSTLRHSDGVGGAIVCVLLVWNTCAFV